MLRINNQLIQEVSTLAQNHEDLGHSHNFEQTLQKKGAVKKMLYGLEPGSYMTPYRYPHTTKSETLVILRGVALIIEFDSDGAIFDHQLLSAGRGCYGVEVRSELYHTLIALESGTVLFEIEGGKRKHNQKDFAPWAPNGENTEAVSKFQKDLLKQLGFWEKKY